MLVILYRLLVQTINYQINRFIQGIYPCLWNVKLDTYRDRSKTNLTPKAIAGEQRNDCEVTVEDVNKKNELLKKQFGKQTRKTKCGQKSGAGTDDAYIPKLWGYGLFHSWRSQR